MQPQQQPQQPQPGALDFTQQPTPQPPAPQPVQPQFDPQAFKQEVIEGVKEALAPTQQPVQQSPVPQPSSNQPEYFNKQYDDWGVLEQDTKKLVADVIDEKFSELNTQQTEAQRLAEEQEKQNQQAIDNSLGQLRQVGYLPPVQNPLDENDLGKQAENELIGYAVALGTTNLEQAAKELKYRHDNGQKYDYKTRQWVMTGQPQEAGPSMFGALPVNPDQPMPQQPMQPPVAYPQQVPQYMAPQPYGPQNPYAPVPQYPAGFNAPVSNGAGAMGVGMAGQVPSVSTLRRNSYDALVDTFNRTQ